MPRWERILKTLESHGINPGSVVRDPKVIETEAQKAADWSKYFDETQMNPTNPEPVLEKVPFLNEDAPLGPLSPHFNPTRQTPDDIEQIYRNEIKKRHQTNSQLQEKFPESQNLEKTQIIDPEKLKRGGAAAFATMPTTQDISPLGPIQQGIDYYKQNVEEPMAQSSEQLARKLVGGTTPLMGSDKQKFVDENAPLIGMGINPTNYMPYVPEASLGADAFSKLRSYLRGK